MRVSKVPRYPYFDTDKLLEQESWVKDGDIQFIANGRLPQFLEAIARGKAEKALHILLVAPSSRNQMLVAFQRLRGRIRLIFIVKEGADYKQLLTGFLTNVDALLKLNTLKKVREGVPPYLELIIARSATSLVTDTMLALDESSLNFDVLSESEAEFAQSNPEWLLNLIMSFQDTHSDDPKLQQVDTITINIK